MKLSPMQLVLAFSLAVFATTSDVRADDAVLSNACITPMGGMLHVSMLGDARIDTTAARDRISLHLPTAGKTSVMRVSGEVVFLWEFSLEGDRLEVSMRAWKAKEHSHSARTIVSASKTTLLP